MAGGSGGAMSSSAISASKSRQPVGYLWRNCRGVPSANRHERPKSVPEHKLLRRMFVKGAAVHRQSQRLLLYRPSNGFCKTRQDSKGPEGSRKRKNPYRKGFPVI